MNVDWVISSKNEFYCKRRVVWSQFIIYNLVNPATIWGKRPNVTINIANLKILSDLMVAHFHQMIMMSMNFLTPPVLSSILLEEHSDSTLTTLSTPQNDIMISQHLQLPGKGSAIWSIFTIVLSTVWQLYSIQCRPQ